MCEVRTRDRCTARFRYRYKISTVKRKGLFETLIETEKQGRVSAFHSKCEEKAVAGWHPSERWRWRRKRPQI